MLSHDFEGFPCTICLKMVVSGFIVREHFETSVMQMLEQNPLMRSRLTRRFGRSIWQIQSQIEQVVHWKTADTNPEWPATSSIDLAVHHGLKLEVHQTGREDSHIFATVHHAVADGQGIIAAFHEMWLCYDSLCRGDTVPRIERSESLRTNWSEVVGASSQAECWSSGGASVFDEVASSDRCPQCDQKYWYAGGVDSRDHASILDTRNGKPSTSRSTREVELKRATDRSDLYRQFRVQRSGSY